MASIATALSVSIDETIAGTPLQLLQLRTETIRFGTDSWAATPHQKESWDLLWKRVLAMAERRRYTEMQKDLDAA